MTMPERGSYKLLHLLYKYLALLEFGRSVCVSGAEGESSFSSDGRSGRVV